MTNVALSLAKYTYFGKARLEHSTVTGKEEGSDKLDTAKLAALKNDSAGGNHGCRRCQVGGVYVQE